jgi:hypothetical protein
MNLNEKIRESGVETQLPRCDGVHFFDVPMTEPDSAVGAWFCGDDEYEQAVCGIVVMRKTDGFWQAAFHAREDDLGTQFIAPVASAEQGELCFARLGKEDGVTVFAVKYDGIGFILQDCAEKDWRVLDDI